MALTTTATVSVLKPTGSIHLSQSGGNKVFYTVPDGKFFIGYLSHSASGTPIKINNIDSLSHANLHTSSSTAAYESTLYAGDTVSSQSSGNFFIHGCEYDL